MRLILYKLVCKIKSLFLHNIFGNNKNSLRNSGFFFIPGFILHHLYLNKKTPHVPATKKQFSAGIENGIVGALTILKLKMKSIIKN